MNILFLCTGNSCRSVLAEALFRHLAPSNLGVQSAGSNPTGFVHEKALEILRKNNVPTDNLYSKSWDNLQPVPDVVISLCSSAQGEVCPTYLGKVVRSHWGMEDPAKADDLEHAFKQSFSILHERILKFLALPLAELEGNDKDLKQSLDEIGK